MENPNPLPVVAHLNLSPLIKSFVRTVQEQSNRGKKLKFMINFATEEFLAVSANRYLFARGVAKHEHPRDEWLLMSLEEVGYVCSFDGNTHITFNENNLAQMKERFRPRYDNLNKDGRWLYERWDGFYFPKLFAKVVSDDKDFTAQESAFLDGLQNKRECYECTLYRKKDYCAIEFNLPQGRLK